MKHIGSNFEYETERNQDLMRAFREAFRINRSPRLKSVYERVVNMPSCRFWVSEERAAIVISRMFKGKSIEYMRGAKKEMYNEIYRRVIHLLKIKPHFTIYEATFDVVGARAPKFYLSPGSAKVIICKIRREWYTKRKRLRQQL